MQYGKVSRANGRLVLCTLILCFVAAIPAVALRHKPKPALTNLIVLVTDHVSHKPIFQAHLTLQFRDPNSRLGKVISYTAKTDLKGEYKFNFIPMERIYLIVTDPVHQTFGGRFQITRNNQVIRVRLRKPQPLR